MSLLVGMLTGGAVLFYYAWWKQDRIPASLVELDTQARLRCAALCCAARHCCGLSCHGPQRCRLPGSIVLQQLNIPLPPLLPTAMHMYRPQMFFEVLLPPVIFNAGFSIKKKNFFRHFTTLTLFGVVGTFMTAGLIAAGAWLAVASSLLWPPRWHQ